jgi:hypothetical protein
MSEIRTGLVRAGTLANAAVCKHLHYFGVARHSGTMAKACGTASGSGLPTTTG